MFAEGLGIHLKRNTRIQAQSTKTRALGTDVASGTLIAQSPVSRPFARSHHESFRRLQALLHVIPKLPRRSLSPRLMEQFLWMIAAPEEQSPEERVERWNRCIVGMHNHAKSIVRCHKAHMSEFLQLLSRSEHWNLAWESGVVNRLLLLLPEQTDDVAFIFSQKRMPEHLVPLVFRKWSSVLPAVKALVPIVPRNATTFRNVLAHAENKAQVVDAILEAIAQELTRRDEFFTLRKVETMTHAMELTFHTVPLQAKDQLLHFCKTSPLLLKSQSQICVRFFAEQCRKWELPRSVLPEQSWKDLVRTNIRRAKDIRLLIKWRKALCNKTFRDHPDNTLRLRRAARIRHDTTTPRGPTTLQRNKRRRSVVDERARRITRLKIALAHMKNSP